MKNILRWLVESMYLLLRGRIVLSTPPLFKYILYWKLHKGCSVQIFNLGDLTNWISFRQVYLHDGYVLNDLEGEWVYENYKKILLDNEIPVLIDLGANCGLASTHFRSEFPELRLYTVELNDRNYEALKWNLRNFDAHNTCAAISNFSGLGSFKKAAGSNSYRLTKMSDDAFKEAVDVISFRRFYENIFLNNNELKPFILKMDIEGEEINLLKDHMDLIARFPVVFIELHDWLFEDNISGQIIADLLKEMKTAKIIPKGDMILLLNLGIGKA